ncbi:hypothetical protein VKS41_006285 [Umbelopsis sp. WA50703]
MREIASNVEDLATGLVIVETGIPEVIGLQDRPDMTPEAGHENVRIEGIGEDHILTHP